MRAIAMLGNEQTVRVLSEALKKQKIDLVPQDFVTMEEVADYLGKAESKPDAEPEKEAVPEKEPQTVAALILLERVTALSGPESFIKALREISPTLRIIWCATHQKKNEEFENWCYKQRVYDFFYPNETESYNIVAIGKAILAGPVELAEQKGQKGTDLGEESKWPFSALFKRRETKEIVKEVIVEKTIEKTVMRGPVTVGITSLTPGAGATSLAVQLAESFAPHYKTAVVEADGKADLNYVRGNADYFVLQNLDEIGNAVFELTREGFQYVLVDYGVLFKVQEDGEPDLSMTGQKAAVNEFFRSTHRMMLCLTAPWHLPKLRLLASSFIRERMDEHFYVIFEDEAAKMSARYGIEKGYVRSPTEIQRLAGDILPDVQPQQQRHVGKKRLLNLFQREKRKGDSPEPEAEEREPDCSTNG